MALPPRKEDRARSVAARHAPKMERRIAQTVEGRLVKGSGCGWEKGDARKTGICRIEAKATERKSFSVTREMVEKIESAALGAGELPAIAIDFVDSRGNVTHSCYVVPKYAVEDLLRGAS